MRGACEVSAMVSMTRGSAPMVNTKLAPKAWAGAEQIAEIDGLRSAFDADGEISAGGSWLGFHGWFMP